MYPRMRYTALVLALVAGLGGIGLLLWAAYLSPPVLAARPVAATVLAVQNEGAAVGALADSASPPASPVKLIFVHHSCGGNWLADIGGGNDQAGGLGAALMSNNYFVSATNYGWGPNGIGSNTNVPDWPDWFTGANSGDVLDALYDESDQNIGGFGDWSRLGTDPGGENEIIMFKSCFPNSNVDGNPNDPPASSLNGDFTVSNFKAVYNNLLTYFETRQDKLFIVVTAPPLKANKTTSARAANARAFNDWLVNDWLAGYAHNNVAVFDFYNVLTAADNHHRWHNGQIEHVQPTPSNVSAYPSGDSHPTAAGNIKSTTEFVPLLNVYYNRWQGGGTCVGVTDVSIDGPAVAFTDTLTTFTAGVVPTAATAPITYTWSPEPESGQGTATAAYRWHTPGNYAIGLVVQNCSRDTAADTHTITVTDVRLNVYLAVVLKTSK